MVALRKVPDLSRLYMLFFMYMVSRKRGRYCDILVDYFNDDNNMLYGYMQYLRILFHFFKSHAWHFKCHKLNN